MSAFLSYKLFGSGEPIILLHGLFGSNKNCQLIAQHLAESYRVYAVDLRNHGNSFHVNSMSYDEMAGDIFRFIDEQELDNPVLIGHSTGGKTAMVSALQKSDLIKCMVILDIAPISYQNRFKMLITAMDELPLNTLKSNNEADTLLQKTIKDEGLRRHVLQNLVNSNNGNYEWSFNLSAINNNINILTGFPEFEDNVIYSNAVLFLFGEKSDYLQENAQSEIHRYFPNAIIETVPGAGHWLFAEQLDFTVKEIQKFLNEDQGL